MRSQVLTLARDCNTKVTVVYFRSSVNVYVCVCAELCIAVPIPNLLHSSKGKNRMYVHKTHGTLIGLFLHNQHSINETSITQREFFVYAFVDV